MTRSAQILISYRDLANLRALAEIDNAGCAEVSLALILAKYFADRPEITELTAMEADAKKQARKEWAAKWKRESDNIPGL